MVHAAETSLQKLLEGTKQYQVPLYQRTYQWGIDQLRRLWGDVAALAEDRGAQGSGVTHFIGSLVLAPSPALGPTGVQGFLVVDGQQRLTTLTLLLCAIRDHRAATETRQHFDRINEKYLINKWEDGAPAKLMPTQADRGSYLACVHASPQAGGDDAVGAAYRFFRARLLDLDDPDDLLDIQRVEEAVISGLSVVAVTAQQGDNAHRIFESLNNTGLRLTQGDLLRNYLFMRLPARGEHVYRTLWLPLQDLLSSDDLELLFWLDLVQRDETVKQGDTYAVQQARLDRLGDEDAVEREIARLAQLGRLLATILDPDQEPHPGVRSGLQRLDAWGTTTVYPILLHLLERRARGAADDAQVVAALGWLESYLVRRVVSGKATSNLNRILLRAAPEIAGKDPVDAALRTYLSTGRKFWATDTQIRQAARTVSYYWSGRAAQKALILRWLEESLGSKEPVIFKGLTLEHVLPQTATAAWQAMLAEDLADGEELETVYQSLLHTIGNITLTGYNTKLEQQPLRDQAAGARTQCPADEPGDRPQHSLGQARDPCPRRHPRRTDHRAVARPGPFGHRRTPRPRLVGAAAGPRRDPRRTLDHLRRRRHRDRKPPRRHRNHARIPPRPQPPARPAIRRNHLTELPLGRTRPVRRPPRRPRSRRSPLRRHRQGAAPATDHRRCPRQVGRTR